MKKGTKIYSIINFKCPCCQEGKFFISNPYNFKFTGDIYENCSVCGKKYMLEPGFYQGAMYVAYGLGVVLFLSIWVSCNLFFPSMGVWTQISIFSLLIIFLGPLLFSLSKIIYANIFMKFDTNAKSNFLKSKM
jgi:uncharacterized protein (DUF983 family)